MDQHETLLETPFGKMILRVFETTASLVSLEKEPFTINGVDMAYGAAYFDISDGAINACRDHSSTLRRQGSKEPSYAATKKFLATTLAIVKTELTPERRTAGKIVALKQKLGRVQSDRDELYEDIEALNKSEVEIRDELARLKG